MSCENPAICVARLESRDVPAALKIQSEAYPPFLVEEERAFRSRLNLPASYCLSAKRGGELVGYLLAHAWKAAWPPPVGEVLTDGMPNEVLYIHDVAVASSGRGLGVGRTLITRASALAAEDGLRRAELIAVEGAANYWFGLGFFEGAVSCELRRRLRTYGASARWMTRDIAAKS